MKIHFALLMITLIAAQTRHARGESGTGSHGGDAVVCYNQDVDLNGRPLLRQLPLEIISVELLDHWEWRQSSTRPIELGPTSWSVDQKVRLAIGRLKTLDPIAGRALEKIYSEYAPAYVDRAKIPSISDYTPRLARRSNCVIEQLAIQRKAEVFGQAWIQVDKKIYDLLSKDEQAGLALHEILYRFALNQERPPTNSDGVRYLNFIFSTDTRDVSPKEYAQILDASKISFDHRDIYAFYHFRIEDSWREIGIRASDYDLPPEDGLLSLVPTGFGRVIELRALTDNVINPIPGRFTSSWRVMKDDVVAFELKSGFPFGIKSHSVSRIERSGKDAFSLGLLGNSACVYRPGEISGMGSVDCEAAGKNVPAFVLAVDGMNDLPLSGFQDDASKRVFVTHGKNIALAKTFTWPRPTVTKTVLVSGSAKTTLSVILHPNETKWTRYSIVIECLAVSDSACTGNASGSSFHLKPGESASFPSRLRNPWVISRSF